MAAVKLAPPMRLLTSFRGDARIGPVPACWGRTADSASAVL